MAVAYEDPIVSFPCYSSNRAAGSSRRASRGRPRWLEGIQLTPPGRSKAAGAEDYGGKRGEGPPWCSIPRTDEISTPLVAGRRSSAAGRWLDAGGWAKPVAEGGERDSKRRKQGRRSHFCYGGLSCNGLTGEMEIRFVTGEGREEAERHLCFLLAATGNPF